MPMSPEIDRCPRRAMSIMGSLCGILGVILLGASFVLASGPPPDAGPAELTQFGQEHHAGILIGAWLQAVAPFLIAVFAFVLVHLSGAAGRVSGWMTFLGVSTLMIVSLVEVTFYISAMSTEPLGIALISVKLVSAIQHLYFAVAAPAVFLPLGLILLRSRILPVAFSYSAMALAAVFWVLGAVYMLTVTLPSAVTAVGAIQAVWWLSAATSLAIRGDRGLKTQSA